MTKYKDMKADFDKQPEKLKDLCYIHRCWNLIGDDEEFALIGDNEVCPEYIEAVKIFPHWELLVYGMLHPNAYFDYSRWHKERIRRKRSEEESDMLLEAHEAIYDTLEGYPGLWNRELLDENYTTWDSIVSGEEEE